MNPDWLRGLRIPLGETPQFPKELKRQIFCAVDVKSFRNVSIMYADLEVLRVVDCYYPDAADKTQHITLPLASYNPSLNWYYSLGATTFTKGLGKPGEPYIDNTIKWLMDVASPAGKYLVVWFFLAGQSGQSADYNAYFEQATAKFGAPSQDFLATGNPDSFPDFKNAKDLVFPSQMAINSGE